VSEDARPYEVQGWWDDRLGWCARVTFAFPGLGNTGPAEEMKHRGLRAAKLLIKKQMTNRVRYEIVDNKIDQLNRLHSLTVCAIRTGKKNG